MAILLVDDSDITLEVERMMLESNGVTVETALSGMRAVELAKSNNYALIFMDVQMPGMDGFSASEMIRKFNKEVPIIALSAEEIPEEDPSFLASGMNGTLKKPLQVKALKQVLTEYLNIKHRELFQWRRERDTLFEYQELCDMVGDMRAVQNILYRFLVEHKNDCAAIHKYIEREDYRSARDLLHNIIGISGNLFCHRLYETATILDAELRMEHADRLYVFDNVWNDTIAKLSEHCQHLLARNENKSVEAEPIDWKTLLQEFVAFAGEFDSETTAIFNQNDAVFAEHLPEELYEQLKLYVNRYDFLKVQNLMEDYRNV